MIGIGILYRQLETLTLKVAQATKSEHEMVELSGPGVCRWLFIYLSQQVQDVLQREPNYGYNNLGSMEKKATLFVHVDFMGAGSEWFRVASWKEFLRNAINDYSTCSHGNTWISACIGNHMQSNPKKQDWTSGPIGYRFAAIERRKIKFMASNMDKSVVVNLMHKNSNKITTVQSVVACKCLQQPLYKS